MGLLLMRFDLLTASIGPGIYAPLALMAGGFLLAVGCLIAFMLLRRKRAKPAKSQAAAADFAVPEEAVNAARPVDVAETSTPDTDHALAPARRRRRSLVGGAERDEGTPAGVVEADEANQEVDDHTDAQIETIEINEDQTADEFSDSAPKTFHEDYSEGVDDDDHYAEVDWADDSDEVLDASLQTNDGDFPAAVMGALPAEADSAAPDAPIDPEVKAARRSPIVFRQFLPQIPGQDGLSFYGGQPIGPANFQWPRERGAQGGAPLQFLMQWDCAELANQDPTGLLPQDGVLYCFVNCDRDDQEDFLQSHAFVHHRGSPKGWNPIDIPEDAGPALGQTAAFNLSGCTDCVPNAADYVPRVMPRFPFSPMAFQLEALDGNTPRYWSQEHAAEGLLNVQKSGGVAPAATSEFDDAHNDQGRPFAAFPHDFGAIRVIASQMIEALRNPDPVFAEGLFAELSPEEREAQFTQWFDEATELYLLGTQRPEGHKLESNIADDIWNWFDARRGVLGGDLNAIVIEAVDLSLSVSSEALSNVPAKWINMAMDDHALAREYESDGNLLIHAVTPARMFGPPTYAEDLSEALVNEHILLLELPTGAGPQHDFGGKTLQYWITPDDLASGKFDAVKSIVVDG